MRLVHTYKSNCPELLSRAIAFMLYVESIML